MEIAALKNLLLQNRPEFWPALQSLTRSARDFEELFLLSSLRRKAHARQLPPPQPSAPALRLAILGGYSLYPLHELIEHLCETEGQPLELWQGDYDNYIAEIMDDASALYTFAPQVVFLLPAERRCAYTATSPIPAPRRGRGPPRRGLPPRTPPQGQRPNPRRSHPRQFPAPARHDLGAFRSRTLASDWSFRQWVNLELGLAAPPTSISATGNSSPTASAASPPAMNAPGSRPSSPAPQPSWPTSPAKPPTSSSPSSAPPKKSSSSTSTTRSGRRRGR